MKKELRERLKKYGLGAGAVVAGTTATEAQMVYTDIIPDDTITVSSNYMLDLDNNSSNDFGFNIYTYLYSSYYSGFMFSTQEITVQGIGNNRVMNDSSGYPYALNNGAAINNSANWGGNGTMYSRFYFAFSSFTSSSVFGNWANATDKYLGLRLNINGNFHYGWARISMLDNDKLIIKDYAYQVSANFPTTAGNTSTTPPPQANPATNILGTDISNNGNGSDLKVTFNMAVDEFEIGQYRLMVVKSANAGSFTMADAQAVSILNRVDITPTGSNITHFMNFGSKDVDGDFLQDDVPYRLFVLSVADGVDAFVDSLSAMSPEITLTTPILPADPATNVVASDAGNNGNGSDMLVAFDMAADESGIDVYKVIVAKEASASAVDLALAQSLNASQYVSVTPTGSNISTLLISSLRDTDGDLIEEDEPYRVFIHSVANNTTATVDTISSMSNQVTLIGPQAGIASDVEISDITDFGNGSDIRVQFTKAADESTVSTYRIIIVKSANAPTFTLAMANALTLGRYTTVYPTGNNINTMLNSGARDSDGDVITASVPYRAFILSMADGTNATVNNLSTVSNEETLEYPQGINPLDAQNTLYIHQQGTTLEVKQVNEPIARASLYDLNGRLLKTMTGFANTLQLSIEGITTGVYIVETQSDNLVLRERFFISAP